MRVLIINSRYFPAAGPEKYLFSVSEVLESHGHEVIPFSLKHSRNLPTPYSDYFAENIGGGDDLYYEEMGASFGKKLQLVERQFYSMSVKKSLDRLIDATEPDVAYILHYQNRLSPSVISACKQRGVPTVVLISDFSMICTRNNLLREGSICELCPERGLQWGVRHRCVKGSYAASLVKAAALKFQRVTKVYHQVDRYVVPSRFTISKLAGILGRDKVSFIPTLVAPGRNCSSSPGSYALFVGRVEEEKGLSCALEAVAGTDHPLKIVGYSHTGYGKQLEQHARQLGLSNVEFVGPKFGEELRALYENCRFLIAPVIWYENLPNVVLEAMSHGKPVVASDIGSMREVILSEITGLLFPPNDTSRLRDAMSRLFSDNKLCEALGAGSYERVEQYYSPERHYRSLIEIFCEVGAGGHTTSAPASPYAG